MKIIIAKGAGFIGQYVARRLPDDELVAGWDHPEALASAWDDALDELSQHGMTSNSQENR